MGLLYFIVFVIILTCLATTTTVANFLPKYKPLVTNIIHRNSIFSATYNQKNDTIARRAKSAIENSIARFASLVSKSNIQKDLYNDDNHLFSVNFSIGQPSIPQLAKMDTTTSFIWIQCKPCTGKCFDHAAPTFDPSKSLTYANLTCKYPLCDFSPHNMYYNLCNRAKHCRYCVSYENNYGSKGIFATENFTFGTFDDGSTVVSDVVFGCSHDNMNDRRQNWGAIFGLADSPISLVRKLGNKFSYCIGNIDDPQYKYNKLIIGDSSSFDGHSIPFELYQTKYYLTMKGIRVGEKLLDINPEVFQRTAQGDGGVIIDSDTEFSFLSEIQYNVLQNEISGMLDGFLPRVYNKQRLCYRGNLSEGLDGFPVVAFVLADGVELVLDTSNLFNYIDTNMFCLSILPSIQNSNSNSNSLSIIGIMAQLNYNIGYDLNNRRIYIQRIDCELLED